MKNTFILLLLIAGTCAMLAGFYGTGLAFGWRTVLVNAGLGMLVVFNIAIIREVCRQAVSRLWLLTTILLPVLGGILYLIVREE